MSTSVSNPYTFNIIKDRVFSATCLAENTITITVGESSQKSTNTDGNKSTSYFYGYNSNTYSGPVFGKCSPSTYRGIKISGIYVQTVVDETLQGPDTSMSVLFIQFAEHVAINRIIIGDITYGIGEYHGDDNFGCTYVLDVRYDSPEVQDYFTDNVGKQITMTLELE